MSVLIVIIRGSDGTALIPLLDQDSSARGKKVEESLEKGRASLWYYLFAHVQYFASAVSEEAASDYFRLAVRVVRAIRSLAPRELQQASSRLAHLPSIYHHLPPFTRRGEAELLRAILGDSQEEDQIVPVDDCLLEIASSMAND